MTTETLENTIYGYLQPGNSSEMVMFAILKMLIALIPDWWSGFEWEETEVDGRRFRVR